jgi:hypothetical protein
VFYSLKIFFFTILLVVTTPVSLACPCGCGSSLPLVVDYEDQIKLKLGLSHKFSRIYLPLYGSKYQTRAEVSNVSLINFTMAYGFYEDWSVSTTFTGKTNHSGSNYDSALGDPSVSLSWAFNQHHSRGFYPETYLSLGVKAPLAQRNLDLLKSHSNGFWEFTPSVSFFQHWGSWELGFSDSIILKRSFEKILSTIEVVNPGLINRVQISSGYTWYGYSQLQLSLQHEYRFSDRNSMGILPLSSSQSFLLKSIFNIRVGNKKTISLFYDKPVFLSYSHNIELDDSIGISYTHSI